MPVFKYKAISKDGARVHGVVEAFDKFEAVSQLKETCPVVTSVSEVRSLPGGDIELWAPRQIADKPLALLCSQFAIIITAGLPIVRAVTLIQEQTADRTLKKLLGEVAEDVSAGYGLAQSFESKGGGRLPTTFIETVRAGENSGTLDVSFAKLHTYYDKSAKVKSKVRSAMTYPIFLLVLAAIVITIIMTFTMPTFIDMFENMDMEMPALTRAVIAVSEFMTEYWWLLLLVITGIVIAIKLYAASESGGKKADRLLLRLPALGPVNRMKGAGQFSNTLATLLTAGIPLVTAVGTTARVIDNRYLGMRLGALTPLMEEGRSLGDLLRKELFFPEMLCEMTAVGESTGTLEETLTTIGEYYDAETQLASDRALSMLQPAITVIMGLVIGIIVIALYLPMFSMYLGM